MYLVDMTELRDLIRKTAIQHPTAPASELARHVAKLTPADVISEFYEEALRPLVSEVVRTDRNQIISNALSETPPEPPAQPRRRSPKVAGISNWWWARMLEQSVSVGHGAKKMGDCTLEDFDFIIDIRQAQIEADTKKLAEYVRLRDWMVEHNAVTLREAPVMTH